MDLGLPLAAPMSSFGNRPQTELAQTVAPPTTTQWKASGGASFIVKFAKCSTAPTSFPDMSATGGGSHQPDAAVEMSGAVKAFDSIAERARGP